jgi:two-component system NtrC family response regulator
MAQILIIDDDQIFAEMLAEVVTEMGCSSVRAHTLSDGLRAAAAGDFAVILLDVNLPDGNGLSRIQQLRERTGAEIMIVTAYENRSGAELALDSGAWDYLSKTASLIEMKLSLSRAIRYAETNRAGRAIPPDMDLKGIIGRSDKLNLFLAASPRRPAAMPTCCSPERRAQARSFLPGRCIRTADGRKGLSSPWIAPL